MDWTVMLGIAAVAISIWAQITAHGADKRSKIAHNWAIKDRDEKEYRWRLDAQRKHGGVELRLVNRGERDALDVWLDANDFASVAIQGGLIPYAELRREDEIVIFIEDSNPASLFPQTSAVPSAIGVQWRSEDGRQMSRRVSTESWRAVLRPPASAAQPSDYAGPSE